MWVLLGSFPGGSHIGDSYHLFKNFVIDYSIIHVFVIKNFIGLFSILTTTLTSTCHFNSGQQTSNIKTPSLPSLWKGYIKIKFVCCFSHKHVNFDICVILVLILVSSCRLSPLGGYLYIYIYHRGGRVFILFKDLHLMIVEYINRK